MRPQGLTTEFRKNGQCNRCNIKLIQAAYKDYKIAYSTSQSRYTGFLCLKCAMTPSKTSNRVKCTVEDLDNFIESQIKKIPNYPAIQKKLNPDGVTSEEFTNTIRKAFGVKKD